MGLRKLGARIGLSQAEDHRGVIVRADELTRPAIISRLGEIDGRWCPVGILFRAASKDAVVAQRGGY